MCMGCVCACVHPCVHSCMFDPENWIANLSLAAVPNW